MYHSSEKQEVQPFLYQPAKVNPVSYTHLDVYKRQICGKRKSSKRRATAMYTDREEFEGWMERIMEPVSYTHLDVYKRQMQSTGRVLVADNL